MSEKTLDRAVEPENALSNERFIIAFLNNPARSRMSYAS